METPVVLTIAGSDSGGGAGIQADIKTFHVLGVHGVCVVTSVTSQNTREVMERFDLPPWVVASQLEAVLDDFEIGAAKTGMLAGRDTVRAVAEMVAGRDVKPLVVDPVIYASSGRPLLDRDGLKVLVERLLPLAAVFAPNIDEASFLLESEIEDKEDMREAARELKELGPASVVVKGGHLSGGQAVDYFYDGERGVEISGARVDTNDDHGTGCVFSAATAAYLALGSSPLEAVSMAKQEVTRALSNSLRIGGGRGPVYPLPHSRDK